MSASVSTASAETRSLTIYHTHTQERATIVFKRDGSYDQAGLKELNHILRDWRRNEAIKMDPALFDLIYEVYRDTGASGPIQVVCGYRSPATNNMLRSRSRGVAKFSQHTLGKAMDFYLSGVPLEKLREVGIKKQIGGVGFYPTSGSPFVHLDTGNVRAWPRMSRDQLVRLFPDGKTMHLPSDGGPLPRYQDAVAEYQRRHGSQTQIAGIGQPDSPGGVVRPSGKTNIIASIFGIKPAEDDEEETTSAPASQAPRAPAATPKSAPAPVVVASAPTAPLPLPTPAPRAQATANRPATASNLPHLLAKPADVAEPAATALPTPAAKPTVVAALPPGSTAPATAAPGAIINLPQPPAAAPRTNAAILPNGWNTGPTGVPLPPKSAQRPGTVPLPAERPQVIAANLPRPRPAVVASNESRPMEDAFSALMGPSHEADAKSLLGYAPSTLTGDDSRSTTTVARDRTASIRLASLGPTEAVAPSVADPQRLTRGPSAAAPKVATKGDRADPMARLISHVTDKVDPRLLDGDSHRSVSMVVLKHPDLDSMPQMIVKPTQILADGFTSGAIGPYDGRFDGPAVVALALAPTP